MEAFARAWTNRTIGASLQTVGAAGSVARRTNGTLLMNFEGARPNSVPIEPQAITRRNFLTAGLGSARLETETASARRCGSTTNWPSGGGGTSMMVNKADRWGNDTCSQLAHKFQNGFMDFVRGRRNLHAFSNNLRADADQQEGLRLIVWYHYFRLESSHPRPYSVVMSP